MPKIGKFQATVRPAGEPVTLEASINVSASGIFYANIADEYAEAACSVCQPSYVKGKALIKICSEKKTGLEKLLLDILNAYATPEVESYPVIRYNIESHVSFCETPDGKICPNGYYADDAVWADSKHYGDHHAGRKANGGYSLTVGARAEMKTITRFGGHEKVEYTSYYKDESHLGTENSAQRLNSWASYSLPDNCQEMPYSDEAAEFFFDMMMGMAKLSKMLQEKAGSPEGIQQLIKNGAGLLGYQPS